MNLPLAFLVGAALAATPEPPPTGSVHLPLPEYHDLVERAGRPLVPVPAAEARVLGERIALAVENGTARFEGTFDLDFTGARPPSLALALQAAPEQLTVTPADGVIVGRGEDGVLRVAVARPGRVTLRLRGVARIVSTSNGGATVKLAPALAPVAELTLDLPADLGWSVPETTLAEDTVTGPRRLVRLARAAGTAGDLELRGRVAVHEEASAYVRGVTVTLIEPGPDTILRTDAVLYEVQRGFLSELAVRLPAGYEPDPAATTDEEAVPYLLDGDRLVVARRNRLAGRGHLLLTSRPAWPTGPVLALPALEPEVEVRSRFLVAAASLAANLAPQPAAAWTRVDREDLPSTLRDAMQGLALAAVWRLNPGVPATGLGLAIEALPPVALATGILPERRTVTVATVDGSLVHRDEIEVESGPAALAVVLGPNTEFWSATVNGEARRPVERDGALLFSLPPGRGRIHRVQLVVAEKRQLPAGKNKQEVRFQLPVVRGSVLRHEWRLMLPENRDYRLIGGELRAVPPPPAMPPPPPAPVQRAGRLREEDKRESSIDEARIQTGETVTVTELEKIPTARDPWVVLQNVPEVLTDRVNVGGNESGQQSTFLGPLPVQAKVPETGKAVILSGALPPETVSVTIESRPIKKGRR